MDDLGCGQIAALVLGGIIALVGVMLAIGFWPVTLVLGGMMIAGFALKDRL